MCFLSLQMSDLSCIDKIVTILSLGHKMLLDRFVGNSHFGEDEIHTGGVEWEDVKVGTGASLIEHIAV